jgi:hypothetical protein
VENRSGGGNLPLWGGKGSCPSVYAFFYGFRTSKVALVTSVVPFGLSTAAVIT